MTDRFLKLFKRNSRRVELTEAGRVFRAGARQTLVSARKAVAQAQEVAKGERGRLVMGNIGGFEPRIESIANSSEDMISMVAAGRGVWLAPEIAVHGRLEAINYRQLDAIERRLEVSAIWKKRAELPATAQQFLKVLKESANSALAERREPGRQLESFPSSPHLPS